MPLLPGKKNIGHNIEIEESHGKPHKQAVAIALKTAGVSKAKDAPEVHATTAMTIAEINAKNHEHWHNTGPSPAAPMVGGTRNTPQDARHVPVYDPHAHDEVSPTQSDPPDTRSDNLLEKGHGGLDASAAQIAGAVHGVASKVEHVASVAKTGAALGEKLARGGDAKDSPENLAEGREGMPVEDCGDAISPQEHLRLKKAKMETNQAAKKAQTGSYAYKKPDSANNTKREFGENE